MDSQKSQAASSDGFVEGELLIGRIETESDSELQKIYNAHGAKLRRVIRGIGTLQVQVPLQALDAFENALKKSGKVRFVERNIYGKLSQLPNDPYYHYQWHHTLMNAPAAWDITTGSASAPIAVLDMGFDPSNLDLGNKLLGLRPRTWTVSL